MSVNPLMIKSDPENRNMRIETIVIVPRHIDDSSSGGSCQFILPHRGYLSGDSRIVIPATCVKDAYQYCPNSAVYGLISQATMRVGDVVVAQVDSANQLYAMRENLSHLEKRENIEHVLHGTSNSYETCSGGRRTGNKDAKEVFAGQMRLVGSDGYKALEPDLNSKGRQGARPCLMEAQVAQEYRLSTFYKDTATEAGTPEFTIELSSLFPGFFGQRLQLPLQLINMEDEVSIELVFSDNSGWGSNERAVLCGSLAEDADKTSTIAVAWREQYSAVGAKEQPSNFGVSLSDQIASPTNVANRLGVTGTGSGLRIMYDTTAGGLPENIRVLDAGKGYADGDWIEVVSPGIGGAGDSLGLCVASGLSPLDTINEKFSVVTDGANYVDGKAELVSLTNPDCSISVQITTNAGAITAVDTDGADVPYDASRVAQFLGCPGWSEFQVTSDAGDGNARVVYNLNAVGVTTANTNGPFTLGSLCELSGAAGTGLARVIGLTGGGAPNQLDLLDGQDWSGAGPFNIRMQSDHAKTCDVSQAVAVAGFQAPPSVGLGVDLALYDEIASTTTGKINIVTDAVRLATDLIFYEDGRAERDAKEMMTSGINMIYTEFRNVKTTLTQEDPTAYGVASEAQHVRLIGFSNEVLRSLLMQHYPIGNQEDVNFENYGLSKLNPLLLKYCSRDSLAEDGISLQLVLNSIPRFPSPINFNPQFYCELADVFGSPFYIPHGVYNGATSCKQRDNEATTAASQQPGFSTPESASVATLKYELNDRKAGVANQSFMGINQKYLRGMGKYMGIDLKKMVGNFKGNGVTIGSQAVEIDLNYKSTRNPYYSGQGELNIYGEVERIFQLVKGKVYVTSSTM